MILDSGERREFATGAVRDIQEGKGRCDLLPLGVCGELLHDPILKRFGLFIRFRQVDDLYCIAKTFIHHEWKTDVYTALLELAGHYQEGCNKYGDRNWEKGIPMHCYIDSAVRHYLKFKRGDTDEDHARAFLWNVCCLWWTLLYKPEMDDLPATVIPRGAEVSE